MPTPVRPPFLTDHRSEDRRNLLRATTEQLELEQPQRNTSTQQAPSASPLPAPATGDAGGASGLCSQLREQLQEALTAYKEESDLHNRVRDSLQRQLCLRNLASEIRTALQSGQQWSPSGQCRQRKFVRFVRRLGLIWEKLTDSDQDRMVSIM